MLVSAYGELSGAVVCKGADLDLDLSGAPGSDRTPDAATTIEVGDERIKVSDLHLPSKDSAARKAAGPR